MKKLHVLPQPREAEILSFYKPNAAKQMHIDGIRHNYGLDSCQFTIPCLRAGRAVPSCDKYSQCERLSKTLKGFI